MILFFFSSARMEEINVLRRILRCFELVSGLKINLAKSVLVGVGCSQEEIIPLANRLFYKVGKLPIQYWVCRLGRTQGRRLSRIRLWRNLKGSPLHGKEDVFLWEGELL